MSILPNLLSLFRILVIPFIIFLSSLGSKELSMLAAIIFLLASLTDYLDGFIARKYSLETDLGALIDLMADKLLVVSLLVWLTYSINTLEIFLLSLILVLREIIISSVRQLVQSKSDLNTLPANKFGKLKTVFQMLSISILLLVEPFSLSIWIYISGIFLLGVASFLSVFSLLIYAKSIYENYKP